jgi:hypothetical protein
LFVVRRFSAVGRRESSADNSPLKNATKVANYKLKKFGNSVFMDDNDTKKGKWGGARKGSGRPKKHADNTAVRTLWLRATDEEWEQFLANLPSDSREKFIFLSELAAKTAISQESS